MQREAWRGLKRGIWRGIEEAAVGNIRMLLRSTYRGSDWIIKIVNQIVYMLESMDLNET